MILIRRVRGDWSNISFATVTVKKYDYSTRVPSFRKILFNQSETTLALFMKIA
jgi:hypothetical protein